jgi:hypothetical protein
MLSLPEQNSGSEKPRTHSTRSRRRFEVKTTKLLALSILMLTLCGCAEQAKQLVPDLSIIPRFPDPPVDLNRPVGKAMLPDLHCLQISGLPCHGPGSSDTPNSAISTAPRR